MDWVRGGVGLGTLFGFSNKDLMIGGSDNDVLWGGTGADVFAYLGSADLAASDALNCDRIRDFSEAKGDTIDLSIIDANIGLTVYQQFSFVGSAGFSNAADELRFDQFAA